MTTKDLLAENEALNPELAEARAKIKEIDNQFVGWLITTPNPGYTGWTVGLEFKNSHGFIQENAIYPRWQPKPMPEAELAAWKERPDYNPRITQQVLDSIESTMKLSSVWLFMNYLIHDYNYAAEYYGVEDKQKLLDKIKELDEAGMAFNKEQEGERARVNKLSRADLRGVIW